MPDFTFERYTSPDGFICLAQSGVRSFVFDAPDCVLFIDCCHGGDIMGALPELKGKPAKLILTHADPDHIGCIGAFDEVYMHPSEMSTLAMRDISVSRIHPLWEGDTVGNSMWNFEALLIPGHTPGSIALLDRSRRILFGGDSVQTGPVFMFGQRRNMKAFISSMEKLERLSGLFDWVYASHHDLEVSPDVIPEARLFAMELESGIYPSAFPAPDFLPPEVGLFKKGRVSFFLTRPESAD